MHRSNLGIRLLAAVGCVLACARGQAASVLTYHDDALRTGWNPQETILTAANVPGLRLLHQVALDEQVDAQPLVVEGRAGTPGTVYVATEANTVYAIDGGTGAVLAQTSLGPAVPMASLPGQCINNSATVGITATPVIDRARRRLYVLAYTQEQGQAVYRLHALDLRTLADQVAPTVLATSAPTASGGPAYAFNATVSRQRAALLDSGGTVYAAFTSFCDAAPDLTRGWVLGWNADTLALVQPPRLTNRIAQEPNYYYLTTIWMSGYGPAADAAGSVYFATSNADPDGRSYDPATNLSESVVKLSGDLATVQGYFTPIGRAYGHAKADQVDGDLGAGGVMLLPRQPGRHHDLAVVAGKLGPMFLLDRDALGGATDRVLAKLPNAGCWCGPSYFTGADGVGRIVGSTGSQINVLRLQPQAPYAVAESLSASLPGHQDSGFFTTVSSNATVAGSAVIWALSRPADSDPADMSLVAVDGADAGHLLFSAVAGTWPNIGGNANLVPTVANGQVYVASYKSLAIFGLPPAAEAAAPRAAYRRPPPPPRPRIDQPHEVTGIVAPPALDQPDGVVALVLREGRRLRVDLTAAVQAGHAANPVVGKGLTVRGDYTAQGFAAAVALRAKQAAAMWLPDR